MGECKQFLKQYDSPLRSAAVAVTRGGRGGGGGIEEPRKQKPNAKAATELFCCFEPLATPRGPESVFSQPSSSSVEPTS